MHPFQKYLGWAQRFFFHAEHGELPAPVLTLSISHDWPLEYKRVAPTFTSVVGDVETTIYQPDQEHHGLVIHCHAFKTAAGTWPNTTAHAMNLSSQGLGIRLVTYSAGDGSMDVIPLIGTYQRFSSSVHYYGLQRPVYVPPGEILSYIHTSAAAGEEGGIIALIIERLKSYPLRLP